MNIPIEIRCAILHLLPFDDVVTMATVCKELRVLALCECKLWTELPMTTLDKVERLLPFVDRAGKLGTSLWIDDIEQHRLAYLANVLYAAVPALRSLGLRFQPAYDDADDEGMHRILHAIAKSAPLLEHLQLAAADDLNPVVPLPDAARAGFLLPLPRLETLVLIAYRLDGPCAAFANVKEVAASVAALCPFPQAALPTGTQQRWSNATLHARFPAVRVLSLMGIEPCTTGDYTLARLPYIDQPLRELELLFDPADARFEDPETARWIAEGTHNVRALTLQHLDCFGVRDAALMSLSGSSVWLRLRSLGGRIVEISLNDTSGRERAVRFLHDELTAHLVRILATPLMPVQALWLVNDAAFFEVLPLFAGYRHLETLAIVYDGDAPFPAAPPGVRALNSVKMLRIVSHQDIEADAAAVVAFCGTVVPRITSVVLNPSISLLHPHFLPQTICLQRVPV